MLNKSKSIIALVLLILFSLQVSAKEFEIKHLEPLNWWVGMQHVSVQLLVQGENISASKVSVEYPGVTLLELHKADNGLSRLYSVPLKLE